MTEEKKIRMGSKITFVTSSDVFSADPEIVEQIKQSLLTLPHALILFNHLFFLKLLLQYICAEANIKNTFNIKLFYLTT